MVSYCLRYTCAYYKRPDMTLDEAQEAAKAHRAIGRSSMCHFFFSLSCSNIGHPQKSSKIPGTSGDDVPRTGQDGLDCAETGSPTWHAAGLTAGILTWEGPKGEAMKRRSDAKAFAQRGTHLTQSDRWLVLQHLSTNYCS